MKTFALVAVPLRYKNAEDTPKHADGFFSLSVCIWLIIQGLLLLLFSYNEA